MNQQMQPIRVLLIEDNPGDVRLIREMLAEPGLAGFTLEFASELAAGLARLAEGGFDILLCDMGLPDSQGLETIERAHAAQPGLPIIVLTGQADQETGVRAIQAGAQDYLAKGQVDGNLLARAMRYAIERGKSAQTIRRLRREMEQIVESAGEGIFCLDLEGRHTLVNLAAARMLDYGAMELLGQHSHPIWHYAKADGTPYPAEECTIYQTLRDGVVRRKDDEVFWRKDGSSFPVEFVAAPIKDGDEITGGVVVFQDITERKRAEEEIARLAATDTLTGIANRRRFYEILERELNRAKRYGTPFSLVMYDLDRFKAVNDTYGHDVGDQVLKTCVEIVQRNIRGADIFARWGGEEFMILTPETEIRAAENLAEKLRAEIAVNVFGVAGNITASFGVTQFETQDDAASLTKKVDDALYRAKAGGRNRVETLVYQEEKRISILLIEDNPGDVRILREMLKESGITQFALEPVDRLETGLERLRTGIFDMLLLDLGLPDSQGLDTLARVREQVPAIPIVVLTGLANTEVGLKAIQQGAQDYLVKGQVDSGDLVRTIRYAIERKKAEEQIKASLREKEVLLSEIHHRVKNNLQVVSSLIRLQARTVKDPKYLGMLNDSEGRIRTMALVHEKLYKSGNLAGIDLGNFLQNLAEDLLRYYKESTGNVRLQMEVDEVSFGIDTIIPCGLIVSELVTNALKHAFPDRRGGEIVISLKKREGGKYELDVADNGIGIPGGLDIHKTETLGLQLVTSLVEMQLKGSLALDRSAGSRFHICFSEVPEKAPQR